MDRQQQHPAPDSAGEDISLGDLASRIWQAKGYAVAIALLAVILAALVLAAQSAGGVSRDSAVGYIELTAISNNAYPNGARFSPVDLTDPRTLAHLRNTLSLPSELRLAEALSVEYGHPATATIRRQRDRAFAKAQDGAMPIADLRSLRTRYQERIDAMSRSALKIRLNLANLDIDAATARAIVDQLPASWPAVYNTHYQILLPPAITRLDRITVSQDFDQGSAPLAADRYLRQARRTLQAINNDTRLSSVTAQNGATSTELIDELDRFRQLFFDPFLAAQVSDEANTLGQIFLTDLVAERRRLQTLLDETTRAIDTVAGMRGEANELPANRPTTNRSEGQPTLSLSDEGLDSVIDLAQQSSMQDYLIRLFDRRLALTEEISSIQTRIEKLTDEQSIDRLTQSGMAEVIGERFAAYEQQVTSLATAAEAQAQRQTARLYETLRPADTVKNLLPAPRRAGMTLGLSAVLGALLGLLGGILMPMIRPHG